MAIIATLFEPLRISSRAGGRVMCLENMACFLLCACAGQERCVHCTAAVRLAGAGARHCSAVGVLGVALMCALLSCLARAGGLGRDQGCLEHASLAKGVVFIKGDQIQCMRHRG